AVKRYGKDGFLPSEARFCRKLAAADRFPQHLEFYGVFSGDELVGFSENHRHGGAVFWESIWYAPARLGDYSSYLLTHAMLDYYVNTLGLEYASDGSRSLYHDTQVQKFFVDKFGFEECPARMHLCYRKWLAMLMPTARFLEPLIEKVRRRSSFDSLNKAAGLLVQDRIARLL
ncbi:MAG: hypothetical protein CVV10_09370, partial [Gammaproteobacteria bacterium HGW-Gammaproteobacteria-14]